MLIDIGLNIITICVLGLATQSVGLKTSKSSALSSSFIVYASEILD